MILRFAGFTVHIQGPSEHVADPIGVVDGYDLGWLGKPIKGARVRNRQVADRALRKLLVDLDEGRVGIAQPTGDPRTFNEWAHEYLVNLERDKGDKGSTIRAYRSTLGLA